MKFAPKLLAMASAFALLSCPAHADPLPIITLTSSGMITEGSDPATYFHVSDSLVGQQFSMSLTIDPNTLPVVEISPDYSKHQNYTDTAASRGELTINGHTYAWVNDQSSAAIFMRRPSDRGHEASIDTYGIANDGMSIYASTDIRSLYNQFLTSTDISQNIVFDMHGLYMLGETYVSVHPQDGGGNGFVLRGTEPASVAWTVSPVPEPAEYAMLAGGLIFAGSTRRRRRRGRAPAAC